MKARQGTTRSGLLELKKKRAKLALVRFGPIKLVAWVEENIEETLAFYKPRQGQPTARRAVPS